MSLREGGESVSQSDAKMKQYGNRGVQEESESKIDEAANRVEYDG